MVVEFDWDKAKASSNLKKHGVSFHEAMTVFGNPLAATYYDPDHSADEDRFITIGVSVMGRLLLVAHLDSEDKLRIIRARRATPSERKSYEEDA